VPRSSRVALADPIRCRAGTAAITLADNGGKLDPEEDEAWVGAAEDGAGAATTTGCVVVAGRTGAAGAVTGTGLGAPCAACFCGSAGVGTGTEGPGWPCATWIAAASCGEGGTAQLGPAANAAIGVLLHPCAAGPVG
jgi:hypothetical protein